MTLLHILYYITFFLRNDKISILPLDRMERSGVMRITKSLEFEIISHTDDSYEKEFSL
jgi:hypothetical protein